MSLPFLKAKKAHQFLQAQFVCTISVNKKFVTKTFIMAEIHVQTKKNNNTTPVWLWVLIGLLIAAAVIYFMTRDNKTNDDAVNKTPTTSYIAPAKEMLQVA